MNSFDTNITNQSFLQFNMANGLLSSGDYSNAPKLINDALDAVYGTTLTQNAALQQSLLSFIKVYLNDTTAFILMNDLSNNNDYVAQTLNDEMQRTSTVRDKTINTVHKTQLSYFQKKYQIKYNYFLAGIFQFLLLIVLLAACTYALYKTNKLSMMWMIAILSTLLVFTLVTLYIYLKNMQTRTKIDWDKYYFSTMETDNTSNSCTNSILK